jgi:hypothetical protein
MKNKSVYHTMEREIVLCPNCHVFVGVETSNGFMIGQLILKQLKGICGCGERFELIKNEIVTAEYSEICK